jgi:hypothetical protein
LIATILAVTLHPLLYILKFMNKLGALIVKLEQNLMSTLGIHKGMHARVLLMPCFLHPLCSNLTPGLEYRHKTDFVENRDLLPIHSASFGWEVMSTSVL